MYVTYILITIVIIAWFSCINNKHVYCSLFVCLFVFFCFCFFYYLYYKGSVYRKTNDNEAILGYCTLSIF